MGAGTFAEPRRHVGHQLVCVGYGRPGEDLANVAVECETRAEVLLDFDAWEATEEEEEERREHEHEHEHEKDKA